MIKARILESRDNVFTLCALRGASFTCNGQYQQAGICGGRKNCKIMRNWYLLFSTYQTLYSYCYILYNGNKESDFYEYKYYIEILTVST